MRNEPKTALVLSGGGLFGAYQAGVWAALAPEWTPDLVIGTSVGSLNGWAIAGSCPPDRLMARWRTMEQALKLQWRMPRTWLDGIVDSTAVREMISAVHQDYQPRIEYGVTVTSVPRPKPHLILGSDVTADHLMASCAIPGIYRQCRIDGKIYSDGGVLSPVPLWAAARQGATHIVSISVLPHWPWYFRALANLSGRSVRDQLATPSVPNLEISPERHLGARLDCVIWDSRNIDRWLATGYDDGLRALPALREHLQFSAAY